MVVGEKNQTKGSNKGSLRCIDLFLAYSYGCGGEKLKERVVRRVLWCIDMFLA